MMSFLSLERRLVVSLAMPTLVFMVRRVAAGLLIVLGVLLAFMGIQTTLSMARLFFASGGVWLRPEPEMLIPIAALLVAVLLFWLGMRLGRQREPE
jgi:hypothetical protein